MNEQEPRETGTAKASHEEMCEDALEHYEKVSIEGHHWDKLYQRLSSFIESMAKRKVLSQMATIPSMSFMSIGLCCLSSYVR